jgi:hypothetical protein
MHCEGGELIDPTMCVQLSELQLEAACLNGCSATTTTAAATDKLCMHTLSCADVNMQQLTCDSLLEIAYVQAALHVAARRALQALRLRLLRLLQLLSLLLLLVLQLLVLLLQLLSLLLL